MVDSRFFHNAGPMRLSAVAELTGAVITMRGNAQADRDREFTAIAPLDRAGPDDISFLDNIKYIDGFAASKAGACFVRAKFAERAPEGMVLLVTEDPYYAYAVTARKFYPESGFTAEISKQAAIAKSATVGKGTRIDAGAVIGENVTLGERCWIGGNSVIGDNSVIGNDCRIGALCSISHTVMGNRVVLHRGIHLGQDGFGFAASPKGITKVPQLGRVLIGDDVEIGSGTCIDRGTGPDTVIGAGSKIDNLVQVGHNVHMGKYVLIAAQCGISGSTHIGDGVMLGGQVGLAGHIRIGAGVKIAAQSGVMHDVPAGATYGGSPALPAREWQRQIVAVAKLLNKKESDE